MYVSMAVAEMWRSFYFCICLPMYVLPHIPTGKSWLRPGIDSNINNLRCHRHHRLNETFFSQS